MALRPSGMYRLFSGFVGLSFAFGTYALLYAFSKFGFWPLVALGLCGAGLVALALRQTFARSALVMTDEVLRINTLFGPQVYSWRDVTHFQRGAAMGLFDMVCFDFAAGHRSRGFSALLTWYTRLLTGADRSFPNTTELSTGRLVSLLDRRGRTERASQAVALFPGGEADRAQD